MISCLLNHQVLFLIVRKRISEIKKLSILFNSTVNIAFYIFQGLDGKSSR